MKDNPIILVFVEDLISAVRIEKTAEQLGFEFVTWKTEESDELINDPAPGRTLGEPLFGREGELIDTITRLLPVLIVFDLNSSNIPWREWIPIITSVPATRNIPVICYGPHIDKEKFNAARKAGAEAAIARSKFMKNLPEILTEHALVIDSEAIKETCQQALPYFAKKGLEEFNRGEYFQAHDSLELAWMEDEGPGRDLYRAILQVAVAYYQIGRGNYEGALKMFLRMRKWLAPLPGVCRGINIDRLRKDVAEVHAALVDLGPEKIARFDPDQLKPVEYKIIS